MKGAAEAAPAQFKPLQMELLARLRHDADARQCA
jgi:hypothetical protein